MQVTNSHSKPKLRPLDLRPVEQDGTQLLVLRDPLQISDSTLAIPYELAPLLSLCDGTRNNYSIRTTLLLRYGIQVSADVVTHVLDACDDAYLLENDNFRAAQAARVTEYRAAPYRAPALAGVSYPADPDELARLFDTYRAQAPRRPSRPARHSSAAVAGVISPHIDYDRGGPVYGAVWEDAAGLVRQAELVIVFGTDHYGGPHELTLTRQSYATPFGLLPNPLDTVDALAAALGPERAFASELHHRSEHAIELGLTWLHYVRRDLAPVPVLPILCGSFHEYIAGQGHPDREPAIATLVETLVAHAAGRRVLVVAGVDLAHVGPAFGGAPQGPAECERLRQADREIMDHIAAWDGRGFFDNVRQEGDRFNVCGLSPIYLALRTMNALAAPVAPWPRSGRESGYAICPADEADTSFVSISGMILE